jgi:MFS transporter, ACS family, glucarate transporter
MQNALHISPVRWGWVLGAFVLSYGVFEIPTGALGDRLGHRRVLSRIVLWWSIFTCLTGACVNFPQLLITRFLFGAGEAGAYPNASGVISRWFTASERGRAQGVIWAASRAGGALSPIVVVPLLTTIGWRATFGLAGLVGFCWVIAWRFWYRDPGSEQQGKRHSPAAIPWRLILRNRQVWLIFVMYGCYAWGSWFFMSWFPTYLVRGVGFTESEMGIFSSFPFLLGVVGNVLGGFATDRLIRMRGLRFGRRVVACTSLAVAALLILGMALTKDKRAIVVFSSMGFGVMDLMLPVSWAVCLDIGRDYSGVLTGIMNSAGQLGGFVCTVLLGYVVRASGTYTVPLWIVAAMVMLSAVLFAWIDPTKPLTS